MKVRTQVASPSPDLGFSLSLFPAPVPLDRRLCVWSPFFEITENVNLFPSLDTRRLCYRIQKESPSTSRT